MARLKLGVIKGLKKLDRPKPKGFPAFSEVIGPALERAKKRPKGAKLRKFVAKRIKQRRAGGE